MQPIIDPSHGTPAWSWDKQRQRQVSSLNIKTKEGTRKKTGGRKETQFLNLPRQARTTIVNNINKLTRQINYTSLTLGVLDAFCDDDVSWLLLALLFHALRFKFPIRCTRLLPTASTAPLGANSVGPCAAVSWTLNSLTPVPFQTPTVPGVEPDAEPTTISLEKMKPQSRDSYQPMESVVHSKECTRIGEGSERMVWMWGSSAKEGRLETRVRASVLEEDCRAASGM